MKYFYIILLAFSIIISCEEKSQTATKPEITYKIYTGFHHEPPTRITIELLSTGFAYYSSTGYQIPRMKCFIGVPTNDKRTFDFDIFYYNYHNYMTITFNLDSTATLNVDPDRFGFDTITLTNIQNISNINYK